MSVVSNHVQPASNLWAASQRFALPGFALALIAVATALRADFLAPGNMRDLLVQAAPLIVVTLGQSLVILVRGLDLSVASVMATVAVIAAALGGGSNAGIPAVIVASIGLCVAIGLINGLLITKRHVSPFIGTLAVMTVLQGIRFAYTQGAPSGDLAPGLRFVGSGSLFGLPMNAIVAGLAVAGFAVLLHKSSFGRKVFIVGGNPRAADLVGIRSDIVTIACYVLCSLLAGLGGLLLVGYVGTVDNWVGRGYDLDSIVAAVVGGINLAGGAGTVWGAVLGAVVLILISNIVLVLGLPVQLQLIIKGITIIAAAAIYLNRGYSR